MEPDDIKQLVRDAAEARATRVFHPLIRASQVKEEPMTINRSLFVKVMRRPSGPASPHYACQMTHPSETHIYDPEGYLDRQDRAALREIIMPRVPGGAGFVLAGGALHHSLRHPHDVFRNQSRVRNSDFDFFPVGLTEEQADTLVMKLVSVAACATHPDDDDETALRRIRGVADWRGVDDVTLLGYLGAFGNWRYDEDYDLDSRCYGVYRTPNAVTITLRDISIQLITRLYPTRESVVRDFDIGPCQVLWDGFDVFMTELGALAYSTGCFPLELDHCLCPRTYARRLHKYLARGYTLLLLDIDHDALDRDRDASIFIPGLGIECRREGLTLTCEADDFHDTVDDDSTSRPARPHLEVKASDPWETSEIMAGCREPLTGEEGQVPSCSYIPVGASYLYRLIDYNPVGSFIANLVALVRGEAFRVLYYSDGSGRGDPVREEAGLRGEGEWLVCSGTIDRRFRCDDTRDEIRALMTSFEYDHELRDAMTLFFDGLDVEKIYADARALLSMERPRQQIEWSYEPPRGTPMSPDEWYGDFIDNSWRIKRY
jgi:hypothetical protein